MDAVTPLPYIEINGHAATVTELIHPLLVNYGHFTAMQVRGGRVRGIDLHLNRLDTATKALFGTGLDGGRVREYVRRALGDVQDASVRVNVFWPDGHDEPSILVAVRPPAKAPDAPLSVQTARYQRPVAHVKHLGGFGQHFYGLRAERDGFDEALLVDGDGVVAEGTIANLGCFDGTSVLWPDAPALDGITMLLLEAVLPGRGVPSRRGRVHAADLASQEAVFVTNSRGIAAVERVDDVRLPVSAAFMRTLSDAYESVPWDAI